MLVTVNGESRDVAADLTVGELIKQLALNPKTVVAQRNGEIVPRESFHAVRLNDGDEVDIVRFVGGG